VLTQAVDGGTQRAALLVGKHTHLSKLSGSINPLVKKILAVRERTALRGRLEVPADGEQVTVCIGTASGYLQQDAPAHFVGRYGHRVRAERGERLYAHRQAERIPVQLWGRVHYTG